jgi:hypothetical protein
LPPDLKKHLIWLCAAVIFVFYGWVLTRHLIGHEKKITSLFYFGSHFTLPPDIESSEFYIYKNSDGYDGQFYLLIAMDPFFSKGYAQFIERPSYRYTRILLPLMAHGLALGASPLIPYTYALVVIAGLALGCCYFLKIIRFYGANEFFVLPYAVSLGMCVAMKRMLPDVVAINLVVVAVYYHITDKKNLFVLFAALAVLAKETMALVPISIFLSSLWEEKKLSPAAFAYLVPLLVLFLWQGVIYLNLPPDAHAGNADVVTAGAGEHVKMLAGSVPKVREYLWGLTFPFLGMAKRFWFLMRIFPEGFINMVNLVLYGFLIVAFLVLLIRRVDSLYLVFAVYGLLISCLRHDGFWLDAYSYSRLAHPIIIFSMIAFFRERKTVLLVPALVMFGEAFHIFFGGKFTLYS